MVRVAILASFIGLMLLPACGKDNGSNSSVQGTYVGAESGTRSGQQISVQAQMTLQESNQQASGQLQVAGGQQQGYGGSTGVQGAVNGVIVGNEIRNFILVLNDNGCKGTLVGKGTLNGNDLTADFSGSTQCGDITIRVQARKP